MKRGQPLSQVFLTVIDTKHCIIILNLNILTMTFIQITCDDDFVVNWLVKYVFMKE